LYSPLHVSWKWIHRVVIKCPNLGLSPSRYFEVYLNLYNPLMEQDPNTLETPQSCSLVNWQKLECVANIRSNWELLDIAAPGILLGTRHIEFYSTAHIKSHCVDLCPHRFWTSASICAIHHNPTRYLVAVTGTLTLIPFSGIAGAYSTDYPPSIFVGQHYCVDYTTPARLVTFSSFGQARRPIEKLAAKIY
jgi:hypothetical protein